MSIRASLLLATMVIGGCVQGIPNAPVGTTGQTTGDDGTAVVVLALTMVPTDVKCIRVLVVGSETVTRTFDVNPGDAATLMFGGLPLGNAVITEATFDAACADVTSNSEATWVSIAPVTLNLVSNGTATASIVLERPANASLTNDFREGGLVMAPSTQDYGSVAVGNMVPEGFSVSNTGRGAIGPLVTTLTGSTDFQIISDTCAGQSLGPATTCSIFVQLKPTKTGAESGKLTVTGGASSVSSTLTGTAASGAMLALTPTSLTFPSTVLGVTSPVQTVNVQNNGGVPSGPLMVTITAGSSDYVIASNGCTQSLAAGASCAVTLQFKPSVIGVRQGLVSVSGPNTVSAMLTGTGLGGLSITPSSATFASVTAGSSGPAQPFTVTNNGSGSSGTLNVSLTSGVSDFTITTNACNNANLGAGQSCQVQVRFNPVSAGARMGDLTATSSTGMATSATLSGTGLAAAAWSTQDIGGPTPAGAFNQSGSSFDVTGGGADVWSTSDAFRFGYQTVSGDATITAKLTSVQNVNTWTKAMLMMRDGTAANARNAAVIATPTLANQYRFQARVTAGGTTTSNFTGTGAVPVWLRLVRSANTFTGSFSADGATWTTVSSATIANMPTALDVGLGVVSHKDGTAATAHFDFVAITKP
jgi:hypothetical protein